MDLLIYARRRPHVEERLTITKNGQFLWFLLIIDAILRLEDEVKGEAKQDLIQTFREHARNENNSVQLNTIDNIEKEYSK